MIVILIVYQAAYLFKMIHSLRTIRSWSHDLPSVIFAIYAGYLQICQK